MNKYIIPILFSFIFTSENKLYDNDPLTMWAGFKTWHWDNSDNTNNDNQIIGIMWRDKFIAYFKNSGHQRSWIIGTGWDKRIIPIKNLYIDVRFGVGIAGGYGYMSNLGGDLHLVPGFVPSFGIGYRSALQLLAFCLARMCGIIAFESHVTVYSAISLPYSGI